MFHYRVNWENQRKVLVCPHIITLHACVPRWHPYNLLFRIDLSIINKKMFVLLNFIFVLYKYILYLLQCTEYWLPALIYYINYTCIILHIVRIFKIITNYDFGIKTSNLYSYSFSKYCVCPSNKMLSLDGSKYYKL